MPIALFFINFKAALILVAFFHVFGNLGRLTFFRHGLDKKLILLFGVPSIILTGVGAVFVKYISQDIFKLILGIFLLIFSITTTFRPEFRFSATKRSAIIGGGLSGFLAGLIGTGGALRGAFLIAFDLEKTRYIASAAAIAIGVDLTRIPIYLGSGFLEKKYYLYVPLLFVIAFAGSYTGRKVLTKIPQSFFRRLVLVAIALMSLKFVIDGVTNLFR